jgi:LPS export ABC transporter protein LptC
MRIRTTADLAPIALSLLLALAPSGCDDAAGPEDESGAETVPDQITTELRVVETTMGHRIWVLEADEAVDDPGTRKTFLTSVTLYFYDRDGKLESTLTAREGEADRDTRHLISRGDVVVETSEGYLLETEVLEWDNGRKKILSDQPVRITQGRNVYTGIGLVSDPGLDSFEILEDFRGTVIDDAGGERAPNPEPGGDARD